MFKDEGGVRLFQSRVLDAALAVQEFHAAVVQPDMVLVVFYCSPYHDLEAIAAQMRRLFRGVHVTGCTTAGEIGPQGYCTHSLSGASFSSSHFSASAACISDLRNFTNSAGHEFAQSLLQRYESAAFGNLANGFALMLIDGLCVREEPVAHAFQYALGGLPLVGGSAGDEKEFGRSYVYFDGRFRDDSAVLALVSTDLPVAHLKSQHFAASDIRLVVTRADAARRIVKEINGLPAAEEYARLIGAKPGELDPARFAASPLVMRINGNDYVRSIQKANPDGSLTFYCAIEEGLVLRLAHGIDMLATLERAMGDVRELIGTPQIVLGSDCVLRELEFEQAGIRGQVEKIYRSNNVVGFCSYGEQYLGIHVNQTLTGLAIGKPGRSGND
jgi:hypothetical protein